MYHEESVHTGFIEGLLSLHGISGTVIHDQTISGPFLIGNKLILDYGVDLAVANNSKFYLNPNATIESRASSSIELGDNLEFWGFDNNNYLDIHGICSFGTTIKFDAGEGIRWLGLTLNNSSKDYQISDCAFTNCDLSTYCNSLDVITSEFTNANLYHSIGNLFANECYFNHSKMEASCLSPGKLINIESCHFMNVVYPSGSSIELNYCNSFLINNCTIEHDYHSDGIGIFNSGTVQIHERLIKNCEIYYPPSRTGTFSDGIRVYNSTAKIENNNIHDNGYGVVLYDNSTSYITGDQYATTEIKTQRIKNNDLSQVLAYEGSFPTEFHWNAIYNDDQNVNFVRYASTCQQNDLDVENNYWGGLQDLTDVLDPSTCFDSDPIWNLGGKLKDDDLVKTLYDSSMSMVNSENYSQAEALFKDIISNFPFSKYAEASLKDLFYVKDIYDQKYQGLKNYFDSTAVDCEQHNLSELSRFFSNQCDIELGNFQDAINWNDSVLLNPESFEDSIFALIDRDYEFLLMQQSADKSDPPVFPTFVPRTFQKLIVKRDSLLELLKINNTNSLGIELPDENENQNLGDYLCQNYPNPFKNQINFSFTLLKDSDVSLSIHDQLGRKVFSFPVKFYEKGTHSIDFMNDKLSPGLYFYKISINNKPLDAKKLIVL